MYKIRLDEDWSFFVGKALSQLCIGSYDVQLHFNDGVSISIYGEDPEKSFNHKTTRSSSSEVLGMPGGAVTLVSLLGATVQMAASENDATLTISFDNEEELRIYDSNDFYESFTINGPNGLIVV